MTQLEDRLTNLLTRVADTVEPHPDVDRVLHPTVAPIPLAPPRRSYVRRAAMLAAAAAAATVMVVGAVVVLRPAGEGTVELEVPAATTDSFPRLLITREGWTISSVTTGEETGEIDFRNGADQRISLSRYRAEDYEHYLDDRRRDGRDRGTVDIGGQDAVVVEADGAVFHVLWVRGDSTFELSGERFADVEQFLEVVATIRKVDEAEWLAALPEGTVRPEDVPTEIEAALTGVPLPLRLDLVEVVSRLQGHLVDRSTLQMEAVHLVSCAWVRQWVDADAAGDEAARQEAVEAMVSSRQWSVLTEEPDRAEHIWDVADAMEADASLGEHPGTTPGGGSSEEMYPPSIPQGTGYQQHLECI